MILGLIMLACLSVYGVAAHKDRPAIMERAAYSGFTSLCLLTAHMGITASLGFWTVTNPVCAGAWLFVALRTRHIRLSSEHERISKP